MFRLIQAVFHEYNIGIAQHPRSIEHPTYQVSDAGTLPPRHQMKKQIRKRVDHGSRIKSRMACCYDPRKALPSGRGKNQLNQLQQAAYTRYF